MKVALITSSMGINGVSQFILNLGQSLLAYGHDVTVVTTEQQKDWWGRLTEVGLGSVHIPMRYWDSRVQHGLSVARFLSRQRFDAIISNLGSTNWAGHQCLHFLPDHMVTMLALHGDRPLVYAGARSSRDVWNLAVAVSPLVRQNVAARIPEKQVNLIPYGIHCPSDAELSNRTDWGTPIRLLYVGQLLNKYKGIFLLPRIVRGCLEQGQAVMLTVIGDGLDRLELEKLFAAEGVEHLVIMAGKLPNKEVYQAMQSHHLLLTPSWVEGFPLVLLEAQANGCVPVASLLPGITEVSIANGESGLLSPPGDSAAFVRQIVALADPMNWRSFSQAGIVRARTLFSVETMGERYHTLLQEMADGAFPLAQPRSRRLARLLRNFSWRSIVPSGPLADAHRLRSYFSVTSLG